MNTEDALDAIDTRFVFKAYAWAAWVTGLGLYGYAPLVFQAPLEGVPSSGGMVARIGGAVLCGAGLLAHAMAGTEDDEARKRALGWWGAAHGVVCLGTLVQVWALIGVESLEWGGAGALGALLAATVLNVDLL